MASKNFIQRQKVFQEIASFNKNELYAQKWKAEDATFTPDIGNADMVLLKKPELRERYETESAYGRAVRLSDLDFERKQQKQQALQQEYYERYSFKPRLNKRSKKLGRASTIEELVAPARSSVVKQRIREEQEREFRSSCPFKPTTNPVNVFASSSGYNEEHPISLIDDINLRKAAKEEKLSRAKMQIEAKQMQECTFQPRITGKPKPPKKPVFVRGIRKFMERKKYAEKLEQDERERVERAFKVNSNILKSRKGGRYTEAKPFKLQTEILNRAKTKNHQKFKDAQSREKDECTFRPQTVYRAKRELVREILNGSGTIVE